MHYVVPSETAASPHARRQSVLGVGLLGALQSALAQVSWAQEIGTLVMLPLIVWQARRLRRLQVDAKAIPEPR